MNEPPRVPLILSPTPCHRLHRLTEGLRKHSDLDLWIKRDDLTGFAFGGNKGRKLEYLMAHAIEHRTEVIVTCGSAQSNFIRQLGVACAIFGIQCVAAVMAMPFEPGCQPLPPTRAVRTEGNLLLDLLAGVDVRRYPNGSWDTLFGHAHTLAEELRAKGKRVWEIPVGGSSALGAYSFVKAADEVPGFDVIVCPCSSGSTQAGLAYAFHNTTTRVVGIACDPEPGLTNDLAKLSMGLDRLTGQPKDLEPSDFDLRFEWVGAGYGIPSEAGHEAFQRLLHSEGIFLDPIYSAKAFAGFLGLIESKEVSGRVLFWHTGGAPALFSRAASWPIPVELPL